MVEELNLSPFIEKKESDSDEVFFFNKLNEMLKNDTTFFNLEKELRKEQEKMFGLLLLSFIFFPLIVMLMKYFFV